MRAVLGIVALALLSCGAFSAAAATVAPTDNTTDLGTVPVRVVNGHLVVLGDLTGLNNTNEMSLEISTEYPDSLTLHPDQYAWIGADPKRVAAGEDLAVHFRVAGTAVSWTIPVREVVPEPSETRVAFQNSMTKFYSTGLGERKLKGTIGIGFLERYLVTLDLPEHQLILALPRSAGEPAPSLELADIAIRPFQYVDRQIRIGLTYADRRSGWMVIGGTEYDSFIDATVAASLQASAGNVTPAWLSDSANHDKRLDLSRYVALRPKKFTAAIPAASGDNKSSDAPIVVTGVNVLEYFRVELDWTNQTLAFTQKVPPHYPQQDFAFFQAELAGDAGAVQAYLEKYPKERLSYEAANLLVQRRLDEKASDAEIIAALTWVVNTALSGRHSEDCERWVDIFKTLPGRDDLVVSAAKLGLTYSRGAITVQSVYRLHNTLGEQYLRQGDLDQAWKHFLSSAFMTPDDLTASLNLARVYDKQGRTRRAYSRYRRVLAAPDVPEAMKSEAVAAMARLRKDLPSDDPLLATNP
jgi:tetratricopeptide (TPR) repeat protein